MTKPILCLDFDGVIHSYTSGWQGADVISDPPVEGAMEFIVAAIEHFDVQIFSSRSNQEGGIPAMQKYIEFCMKEAGLSFDVGGPRLNLGWPREKPPAFLTIDDRALTFEGAWPRVDVLRTFKPWNKRTT